MLHLHLRRESVCVCVCVNNLLSMQIKRVKNLIIRVKLMRSEL